MSDRLIDLGFAQLTYSEGDSSSIWNNALTNIILDSEQIKLIENAFNKLDRKPTIYFENSKILFPLKKSLDKLGYKFSFEDAWQFWKTNKIDGKYFDFVKQIENEKDLEIFLDTFNACYKKDDPQNPYGELGDYLNVARKVWSKYKRTNRLQYFVVFKGSEPVAVSTLTNFENIGYISNVGSLEKVRGEGFGKAATLFCS